MRDILEFLIVGPGLFVDCLLIGLTGLWAMLYMYGNRRAATVVLDLLPFVGLLLTQFGIAEAASHAVMADVSNKADFGRAIKMAFSTTVLTGALYIVLTCLSVSLDKSQQKEGDSDEIDIHDRRGGRVRGDQHDHDAVRDADGGVALREVGPGQFRHEEPTGA